MYGGRVNIPLVIRTQCGGRARQAAPSIPVPEAILAVVPGIRVVMPPNACDAKGPSACDPVITIQSCLWSIRPSRLSQMRGSVFESHTRSTNRCDIKREGSDVTIVTYLPMVGVSLKGCRTNLVREEAEQAEVVDISARSDPLEVQRGRRSNSVKKTRARRGSRTITRLVKRRIWPEIIACSGTCAGSWRV